MRLKRTRLRMADLVGARSDGIVLRMRVVHQHDGQAHPVTAIACTVVRCVRRGFVTVIVDSGTIHSAMIMQGVLRVYIGHIIHDVGIMPVMHPRRRVGRGRRKQHQRRSKGKTCHCVQPERYGAFKSHGRQLMPPPLPVNRSCAGRFRSFLPGGRRKAAMLFWHRRSKWR